MKEDSNTAMDAYLMATLTNMPPDAPWYPASDHDVVAI